MQKTICGHDPPDRKKGKGRETGSTTIKPVNDTDLKNSTNHSNSTASGDPENPEVAVHERKRRSTDEEFEDFDVGESLIS